MKKKILYAFLISTLLSALFVPPASGHHYLYWAEDPNTQNPNDPLKRNFVMVWWWWNSNVIYWIDPAPGSQFAADVRAAIDTNWENPLKETPPGESEKQRLPWEETTSESDAHVKFKISTMPCYSPDNYACAEIMDWEYREPPNGNENALYMKKVDVTIKDTQLWTEGSRIAAVARQSGHIYGLNDAYIDIGTVACNDDIESIMDTFIQNEQGYLWPCDEIAYPTALDIRRVRAYWGGWELVVTPEELKHAEPVIPMAVGAGYVGYYTWTDFAWAEQVHQMGWYWASSSSGPWNLYKGETVTDNIGVHNYTKGFVIWRNVDRRDYTGVPADSWHILCGKAYSLPFNQWGINRCSIAIELD